MECSYRQMLREALLERLRRNPTYSARAMARDLGLSAAFFCQVLNGSRSLTEERAFEVADRLKWEPDKAHRFVALLRYDRARNETARKRALCELRAQDRKRVKLHVLDAAYFEAISHWSHYAILALTTVEGFVPQAKWIARKLGLTQVEAESALRRLRSLGMVKPEGKTLVRTEKGYTTPDDHPAFAAALRCYHDRVLQAARRRLWDDQATREFGSIVVATDPKHLPRIKRRLREFQDEMMAFMEEAPRKAVYQMSVQLFRLDVRGNP